MAKDDIVLRVEMGKLEIEPVKVIKIKEENPFVPVSLPIPNTSLLTSKLQKVKCPCGTQKLKNLLICKKKQIKILKEPVLKLLQMNDQTCRIKEECQYTCSKKIQSPAEGSDILSLCALVDNCNQLRISSESSDQTSVVSEGNNENQWWRTKLSNVRPSRESSSGINQAGTCSQQALNPPCDVTIDELASYFETLVHIPKKMSSMAEMMYI